MTTSRDITVIVPAYQAESFLAATLECVARQTEQPGELIVADDGSRDGTCAVVERFMAAHPSMTVRLLREPHRGPGAARNSGVMTARTEWIAFLDSDDMWYDQKLERAVAAIQANPVGNFFCHNEIMRTHSGAERILDYGAGFDATAPVPPQVYRVNRFSTSAVVCRRALVVESGGFDTTLSSAQDYELWLRMTPKLAPIFIREVLGVYVWRDGNISSRHSLRRLRNMLRIKHRHREKVSAAIYSRSIFTTVAGHVFVQVRATVKSWFGR